MSILTNTSACAIRYATQRHMSIRKLLKHFFSLLPSSFFSKFIWTYLHIFPLKCHLFFHIASPHKDHLPQVSEAADPVTPAKSNSQQSCFWHSSQKRHVLFMLNSTQQLETSIFPSSFQIIWKEMQIRTIRTVQNHVFSQDCMLTGPWGLQKQKRHV